MLCNFDDLVFLRYMAGSQLRVGVFVLKPRTWPDGKTKKHGLLFGAMGGNNTSNKYSKPTLWRTVGYRLCFGKSQRVVTLVYEPQKPHPWFK